ncbi:MAG: hypothetical protein R6W71_13105, partial [Bacteroidales bacterium]
MKEKPGKINATVVSGAVHGYPDGQPDAADRMEDLLSSVYDVIHKVSDYHGGEVYHYTGREFGILFRDDKRKKSSLKALDAVSELQEKLRELNYSGQPLPISMKAGLDYGEIITGFLGKEGGRHRTYLGVTMDIAHRIRMIANWDQL